jgi:tetratricopeptide (TPR) repeat protein
MTGLPALGACFGQLITLDSPSARPPGTYNWASTLRHEMDHVFQLQISNGQLPRWLAEGLSVYEEKKTRPEWERHMEDQLFMHYYMDDIPPVRKFNEWFRDGSKVLFAYYLGNVMLEFIDKKLGGMGAVRKMLEMFGQKKTPGEVFQACLNMAPEEFDERFKAYVRDERIAHLRMVPRISPDRIEQLYFRYEDGEATANELVDLALGYAQLGKNVDAETFIGLASRKGVGDLLDPVGARFQYVKFLLARGDERIPAAQRGEIARKHLETALARGLEDFGSYMTMAQFAQRDGKRDMVLHWLKEAQRAFPENAQPYGALYQFYQQSGQREPAIEAAEKWMQVDENNLEIRMWLIAEVYDRGRMWDKMEVMAQQAINVAPLNARTHQARAYALRKLKRFDEAVQHYEYVRRLATGDTPEEAVAAEVNALLDIAATWLHAEEPEKCRKALEQAKLLDPKNPRIKTIEGELEGEDVKEEEF